MARSSSIGGIFAELTLRDTKFAAGMKSAGAKLKAFGAASVKYGAMAGAALGAGLGAGVKRTIDMGGELTDLSAQTGVAIDDLMRIQQAYKDNGKDASAAAKDINKMQKAIASVASGDATTDPFAKIGLSAEKLMMMEPDEQFFKIAQAIKGIRNPTERAARAMDIFGKSGGSLLAVFDGSDFDSINRSLGKMPELMAEFAGKLDHAGDLLGRLPNKSDQFFTGFTAGIVDHLIPSLESVDNYDFTNMGESLGESLGSALTVLTSGKIWEMFKLQAERAFAEIQGSEIINGWAASINAVMDTAIDPFGEMNKSYSERFGESFDKYSQGTLGNKDVISEIDSKLSNLAESIQKDFELKTQKAPEVQEVSDITVAKKKVEPRKIKIPEFDEYQRRGLSLSASPQANMEKKTLNVMEQVRDILARMERAPQTATF